VSSRNPKLLHSVSCMCICATALRTRLCGFQEKQTIIGTGLAFVRASTVGFVDMPMFITCLCSKECASMWRGVAVIEDCGVVADCNAVPGINNGFKRVTQLRFVLCAAFL
jgi:hypothetical protein